MCYVLKGVVESMWKLLEEGDPQKELIAIRDQINTLSLKNNVTVRGVNTRKATP